MKSLKKDAVYLDAPLFLSRSPSKVGVEACRLEKQNSFMGG